MIHRLANVALPAPLLLLLACTSSSPPGAVASDDAGPFGCVSRAGVIVCQDAAPSGCFLNAAGEPVCADATVDDAAGPSVDAGSPDSASSIPDSSLGDSGTPLDSGAPDSATPDASADAADAAPPSDASTGGDGSSPPAATGALLWGNGYSVAGSFVTQTAADSQGNRYVCGHAIGSQIDFIPGMNVFGAYVAKLDSAGVVQWASETGASEGYGVAIDPATGTVYATLGISGTQIVGGTSYTSRGGVDFLIAKLDALGNVVSAKQFGGTGFDQPSGMAFGSGHIAVTGYTGGPVDFGDGTITPVGTSAAFLLVVDSAFNYTFAKEYGGTGTGSWGQSTAIDAAGNVYDCGNFSGQTNFGAGTVTASGSEMGYVVALDGTGAYRWSNLQGASSGGCRSVVLDASGNVYAGGGFSGGADFGNGTVFSPSSTGGFIAAWSSTGSYRWATLFGSDTAIAVGGIAVDPWGEVAVDGYFSGKGTFGTPVYTATSQFNGYLAKVDATGSFLWSQQWTGAQVQPWTIDVDDTGAIGAAGTYYGGDMTLNGATSLSGSAMNNDTFVLMTKP